MGLDYDTIQELLKKDKDTQTRTLEVGRGQSKRAFERPVQVGPLSYHHPPEMRCASRNCGSPTLVKVRGIPYCMTHALYAMNRELIEVDVSDCNCKAGSYSMLSVHTDDCPVWARAKESQSSDDNTSS